MLKKPYITARTSVLCVIGHPIEHSMSPIMHNAALKDLSLDYVYVAFNIPPNDLKKAVLGFKMFSIKGINVTIPYKENIIPYLDEIDPLAEKIGAVNTIKNEGKYLIGKNTDASGAKNALLDAGCEITGKKALILGAGGAAKAVSFAISEDLDAVYIANRTEKRAIKLAKDLTNKTTIKAVGKNMSINTLKNLVNDVDILINTTPLGMYPDIEGSPISQEMLHKNLFVFDIVYNPLETRLLKEARKIGCKTLGGLDMFVNQGALAFEWWTGKKPNLNLMKEKVVEFLGKK
ncbi:MAG: shikimate dehydrogenase [Promethearchaeota archaeon Loki_b31]|nr:MAG: shikimate dehydrogenase [Candidatus Lokiarchaeota archaeon Loki_b31]